MAAGVPARSEPPPFFSVTGCHLGRSASRRPRQLKRTPLTSVIGYSEMLLEGIAGELNEEQREYVRTVMEKGDQLAPEEVKLLALLVFLIEAFEAGVGDADDEDDDEPDRAEPPQPHETLQRLMQARKLELSDVEHLLGNVHLAREVLAGKRPISRGQAKELAKFFRVPPKLFYS